MATDLQDTALFARIQGGDLTAQEAKYHFDCLTKIRNRHLTFIRQNITGSSSNDNSRVEARVLVELITFIENIMENGMLVFKFSDLRHMYEDRLRDLGICKEMNKTHFKKVLSHFVNAQEQSDGKNSLFVFDSAIQELLLKSQDCTFQEDTLILQKAANMIRKEIFPQSTKWFPFNYSFHDDCQSECVPHSLKLLTNMIITGGDIQDQNKGYSQFGTPLSLYLGLSVHTLTRSKKLVMEMLQLGLSVSYDRVLQVNNELADSICQDFNSKGVVCPSQLRKGVFTIAALDNIDHNPSSTTAKGSFHGTGISLFQSPTVVNQGTCQEKLTPTDSSKKYALPYYYTVVPPVAIKRMTFNQEECWIKNSIKLLEKEVLKSDDKITWSAYHASLRSSSAMIPALNQLLPLFYEKAATAAMIKHGMDVIRKTMEYLNPGQTPIVTFDAPLFALAKQIQWNWPQTYGQNVIIAMFGGLHIEMAMWKTFRDYLESSGWTTALTEAKIGTCGVTDSFLKATHLTHTRHAHQVSALALSKLQHDAFLLSGEDSKESWRKNAIAKSPTFAYWDTILRLELLGLIFVCAHREKNFLLYIQTLKAITPWFFALDHQNYAHWIPIHIRDMESLSSTVIHEFKDNGLWVIQKTPHRFTAMPIDQAHEQNNELVKGSGGVVGLTENPSAFRRWMTSGPEQARLIKEFETIQSTEWEAGKDILTTFGTAVLTNITSQATMSLCNHEEADTRLFIHVLNGVANGAINCLIRTVDTDVVIFLGMFHALLAINPACNVWVAFGIGKNFQYIHINTVYEKLCEDKARALPFFHSFTGCDTTSSFYGRGKKTAWKAWKCFPDATSSFIYMQSNAFTTSINPDTLQFKLLEHFCVAMYDKTSSQSSVDEARKELLSKESNYGIYSSKTRCIAATH
uniref:Uncharacterized protein n=1 Tax=Amphimedon queenslandica TaxID=400682 RepID=A0A1X7TUM9_AMPQE